MKEKEKIVGLFEKVAFSEFGTSDVIAKIDTGAFTGALHCTKIEEIITTKGKVVQFSPFAHPEVSIQKDEYYIRKVWSSNGKGEKRFFINTTINLQGKEYPIILSLADRSAMKWPVLIGRRFLRKNHLLVDVHKGTQYRNAVKD